MFKPLHNGIIQKHNNMLLSRLSNGIIINSLLLSTIINGTNGHPVNRRLLNMLLNGQLQKLNTLQIGKFNCGVLKKFDTKLLNKQLLIQSIRQDNILLLADRILLPDTSLIHRQRVLPQEIGIFKIQSSLIHQDQLNSIAHNLGEDGNR